MQPQPRSLTGYLWAVALLVVLLAGCTAVQPATPEPSAGAPAADHAETQIDCRVVARDGDPQEDGAYELALGECVVGNQLLLSGERGAVEEFLAANEGELSAPGDERLTIAYTELMDAETKRLLPDNSFLFGDDPVTRLVTVREGGALPLLADGELRAQAADMGILVDYNYLMGTATTCSDGIAGKPHSVGAHPHSVGAHPHSVGAHPFDAVAAAMGGAEAMRRHWALGDGAAGIGLFAEQAGTYERLTPITGKDVRVVVMDTSPFAGAGTYELPLELPDGNDIMTLTVRHPSYFRDILPSPDVVDPVVMSNHGLFVAGLVHTVAPDAQIEIVRVLNEYGQGDLFTLMSAAVDLLRTSSPGLLADTVVNLSLGIVSPCAVLSQDELHQLQGQLDNLGYPDYSEDEVPALALDAMMLLLRAKGATIVAAAGNESGDRASAYAANPPASYLHLVLGVTATGPLGERACYSNRGEIAAPGGNPLDKSVSPATCHARTVALTCDGITSCGAGLLSTVLSPEGTLDYAYWAGTSFSTPLISGICALAVSAGNRVCHSALPVDDMTCPAPASGDSLRVANVRVALGERGPVEACASVAME